MAITITLNHAVTISGLGTYPSGTIFTFQDSDVNEIAKDRVSEIDVSPVPINGPQATFIQDFGGVIKNMTLVGQITAATTTRVSTGTSVATITEQISFLEGLMNGNQFGGFTLSSVTGSDNFMITKFDWREEEGNPNHIPFSMTMVVGTG